MTKSLLCVSLSQVQKKAEKINEDLLSDNSESKGLWDSIARYVIYCVPKRCLNLFGFIRVGPLDQMTVATVSSSIEQFSNMPSVCQRSNAISGEFTPPLDPDCNIML